MTPLLSLILIFLIAYLGSLIYKKFESSSPWISAFVYSGSIHIVIGYLLGPHSTGLLTDKIIGQLNVLVGLVLGWTGFLIGLQAKRSELKRFQKSYYLFASLNFIIMLVGFGVVVFTIIKVFKIYIEDSHASMLIIIGAVSSPILIAVLKKSLKLRGKLIHFLQFSVALDNMFGILLFGFSLILFNKFFNDNQSLWIASGISLVFSISLAFLFYKLSKGIKNQQQYFLILIGFLLIMVGVALNLNISLLFISFVFGVTLANLPISTRNLYLSISNAEKPMYFLMLIFTGACINEITPMLIFYLFLFVLVRVGLKYIAGSISVFSIIESERPNSRIGFTHLGMGGVALAMALDYHLSIATDISHAILFIISGAVILNDIISIKLSRVVLNK